MRFIVTSPTSVWQGRGRGLGKRSVIDRRRLVVGLGVALALAVSHTAAAQDGGGACPGATADVTTVDLADGMRAVRCLVNEERRQHGLVAVQAADDLDRAAGAHTRAMFRTHDFDHRVAGEAPLGDRVRQSGYLAGARSWSLGETLALGEDELGSPRALVAALMDSPEHRAIILDPTFREIGVGLAVGMPETKEAGRQGATLTMDFGIVRRPARERGERRPRPGQP